MSSILAMNTGLRPGQNSETGRAITAFFPRPALQFYTVCSFIGYLRGFIMKANQLTIFLVLAIASTVAYSEPLDVKPGLWEVTTTTAMNGMPPIDYSGMPPEQQARIEAAMKAREAMGGRVVVRKSCVTKEKLAKEPFQDDNNESCTHTVISSTRNSWQAKLHCTHPRSDGEFKMEALSRERIKGTVQMNASDDKHAMAVRVSIAGKWLGSACGDVK
jgi:hypothetical protein